MNSLLLAFGALDARLATHCRLLSLRQHEQQVRIGIHTFERQAPQRLWFDVDLCVRLEQAPARRASPGASSTTSPSVSARARPPSRDVEGSTPSTLTPALASRHSTNNGNVRVS